jgi:hypothetical protein
MTPAAEQLFLANLAETNNIRLAAAAAGFAHRAPSQGAAAGEGNAGRVAAGGLDKAETVPAYSRS